MFPTLFELQGLGFHTWGLMLMIAFLAASLVLQVRVGKVGIDPDRMVPLYLIAVVAGLVGSRLMHFLGADWRGFLAAPGRFFDPGAGGFAFYGGAILGVLCGVAYLRLVRVPVWKVLDIGAASIMLGACIGRIGCFFAGCCHGSACPVPVSSTLLSMRGGEIVWTDGAPFLALVFREGVGVGSLPGVPLYPTQLWDAGATFLLFLFLSWMWRSWRRFDGQCIAALLLLYPGVRSTIETFRGDAVRGTDWFGHFTSSQMVSVPVAVVGLLIVAWRWPKGRAPETPFVPEPDADLPPLE
jgi:phosphatidylglycerol---prolipoprotein diacylglyceryl transferase